MKPSTLNTGSSDCSCLAALLQHFSPLPYLIILFKKKPPCLCNFLIALFDIPLPRFFVAERGLSLPAAAWCLAEIMVKEFSCCIRIYREIGLRSNTFLFDFIQDFLVWKVAGFICVGFPKVSLRWICQKLVDHELQVLSIRRRYTVYANLNVPASRCKSI